MFAWIIIGFIQLFVENSLVGLFPLIAESEAITYRNLWTIDIPIVLAISSIISGLLQQIAIRRYWGITIRHWWWITTVGFVAGTYISGWLLQIVIDIFDVQVPNVANDAVFVVMGIVTLVIVSVLQALLLKKYLERIWLFVLAVVLAGIVALFANGIFGYLSTFLSGVLFSASTGLALLWLDHISYEKVDDHMIDKDRMSSIN